MSIDVGVEAETRETGTAGRAREATVEEQGRTTTNGPSSHSHSHYAEIPADLSSGALRRIALDSSPINSAARQKAMRLLELRKVERDVLAVCLRFPAFCDSETEAFLSMPFSF